MTNNSARIRNSHYSRPTCTPSRNGSTQTCMRNNHDKSPNKVSTPRQKQKLCNGERRKKETEKTKKKGKQKQKGRNTTKEKEGQKAGTQTPGGERTCIKSQNNWKQTKDSQAPETCDFKCTRHGGIGIEGMQMKKDASSSHHTPRDSRCLLGRGFRNTMPGQELSQE